MQLIPVVVATGTGDVDHELVRGADHRATGEAGVAAEDATDPPAVATVVGNQARI